MQLISDTINVASISLSVSVLDPSCDPFTWLNSFSALTFIINKTVFVAWELERKKSFFVIFAMFPRGKCFFRCETKWILSSFFKRENFGRMCFFFTTFETNLFNLSLFFFIMCETKWEISFVERFIDWFIYWCVKKVWSGDFLIFFRNTNFGNMRLKCATTTCSSRFDELKLDFDLSVAQCDDKKLTLKVWLVTHFCINYDRNLSNGCQDDTGSQVWFSLQTELQFDRTHMMFYQLKLNLSICLTAQND